MQFRPRALGAWSIGYSKADLLAVSVIALTVAVWTAKAGGTFSIPALVACQAMFLVCYLAGSCLASFRGLAADVLFDLPLRLLVGYGVVNTALLALAWLSPFGVVLNFAGLSALVLAVFFLAGKRRSVDGGSAGLWCVALCLVATSLWCQDSIHPREQQGDVVLFKPWVDGFYHAVHVRLFGASHGASTIEDWRLMGVPARPYHYGMYLLPAFIKQASGIDSYTAFAAILAPVGVFFSGLAAYAFIGSWWGKVPGLAAAAALLLMPDGAQQGMHNTFMSYQWLTQISPSATYGLALLAVAWLFVIRGCVRGSWPQLLAGWLTAAVVLVYKLHFVFASSLLLLLVPALFFEGRLGARRRAVWAAAACLVYGLAVTLGQKVPGVPLVRFDGSSVGEVLRLIQTFAMPGGLRELIVRHTGPKLSLASNLLYGVPYVAFAILGLALPALALLVGVLRRRVPRLYVLFPLLLLANFVIMFFGLALDFASSTPDELSHRPLMIVYFFVLAWLGGALGLLLSESRRWAAVAERVVIGAAVLLLVVPASFGAGVQRMWAMPQMSPTSLPASLVGIAEHIRDHGSPDDVFQDSQFDRIYALAALSERRTFVAHTLTRMPFRDELVQERTAAIERFSRLRQARTVEATARAFGFRWFVLQPGASVHWPKEASTEPVLVAGPFKLYEF